jgi:hypothetical protein
VMVFGGRGDGRGGLPFVCNPVHTVRQIVFAIAQHSAPQCSEFPAIISLAPSSTNVS